MQDAKEMPEVEYVVEILQPIVNGLPSLVERLNLEEGATGDAGQSELVIQREIAVSLKARLPAPSLVRQNELLIRDESGACIPDIVINNIGGGCWAAFELKVHLAGDSLPHARIKRDFDKLSRYKASHPGAYCVFLLVCKANSNELAQRNESGGYQAIGTEHLARHDEIVALLQNFEPYRPRLCTVGRYRTATEAMAWEVVDSRRPAAVEPFSYRFSARMRC